MVARNSFDRSDSERQHADSRRTGKTE